MRLRHVYLALCVLGLFLPNAPRLGLRRRWVPIAAVCLVGVSLGLPLFLYQRQRHLDSSPA